LGEHHSLQLGIPQELLVMHTLNNNVQTMTGTSNNA